MFIAIDLPNEPKEKLFLLNKELTFEGIKPVELGNLHITLKFLGEIDAGSIGGIEQSLREVKFNRFKIKLNGVGVFPNERYIQVVWVGCESAELKTLADSIKNALGTMFSKEEFSAHLTIARVKRKVDLSAFLAAHKNEQFGEFEVGAFVLKSSQLSREGPKYSDLAVFNASDA